MTTKRTLMLDEDDLIMVVKKDVVHQVDKNRGEMTRTEFVNFLIQSQLKEANKSHDYIEQEEFYRVVGEIKELLRKFLDFFLTLELGQRAQDGGFEQYFEKIQSLGNVDNTR